MKAINILAVGLLVIGSAQVGLPTKALAAVGSSISADGSAPNDNAMLDVKSPATGDGKGMLIPRVTVNQRTNANASLAGGLLNGVGELRGGAAQGLIVYQTDGLQGLYFNTSQAVTPAWMYLGGDTNSVSIGSEANGYWFGAAVGYQANGSVRGAAMGYRANGSVTGVAVGASSDGSFGGVAVGYQANGQGDVAVGHQAKGGLHGTAVGRSANGYNYAAAVGQSANGFGSGVAIGNTANGSLFGVAIGRDAVGVVTGVAVGASADGSENGVAVGYQAYGWNSGAAVGREANGVSDGAAVGHQARGFSSGAAVGSQANGVNSGAAVGYQADGHHQGAAVGYQANGWQGAAVGYKADGGQGAAVGNNADGHHQGAAVGYGAKARDLGVAVGGFAFGTNSGVAMGYGAKGSYTNIAIGYQANARGIDGINRIAIGHNVTNTEDNTIRVRGNLYLDGESGGVYTNVGGFGSTNWGLKAFTINHPLDPENKILRHFCMEGPQVWNVYAGNVQLENGFAVVELPDYYSALNLVGSEIYSLTPIGEALVWIDGEVSDNCFLIAGKRDIKVSWTIKVLRNDPGCLEDLRRRPVEQMKSEISNSRTAE